MGSLFQISMVTELPMVFKNFRPILKDNGPLLGLNTLSQAVATTLFKVVWYNYAIFDQMQVMILFRGNTFWSLYP
jgi:hypothetical protein